MSSSRFLCACRARFTQVLPPGRRYLSGIRGNILHFEDGLIMIDDEVVKTLLINLDIIFSGKSIAETGEDPLFAQPRTS